ncbi:hypothetical protein ACQP1G_21215 [Nocardia sp. CA-107356]|uniref:hypothetical protein n=1 Tax=Nocardia sp. CA-107356 TaxID=3239972 RepID=UPI003D901244
MLLSDSGAASSIAGSALAKVETEVALAQLVPRMSAWMLATEPEYAPDLVFHGLLALDVVRTG